MKRSLKAIFSVVFALVMAFTATTAFTTDVFADGQNTAAGYYYDYQVLTVGTHELTPQDGVVTLYDFPHLKPVNLPLHLVMKMHLLVITEVMNGFRQYLQL